MEPQRDEKRYTYADYAAWDTDERYELVDGALYTMSPAPARIHQDLSGAIFAKIWTFERYVTSV